MLVSLLSMTSPRALAEETLYNGIVLPDVWPPINKVEYKPMIVPYLNNPPEVIPNRCRSAAFRGGFPD